MGNQLSQRLDLASQGAQACRQFLQALTALQKVAARKPFLGPFTDADFAGSNGLQYLDAGTFAVLCDTVVPRLSAAVADNANGGQMQQILSQVAPTL